VSASSCVVDALGNIRIHKRGGIQIPIKVLDVSGAEIDISGRSMFFEIKGVVREALEQDPANPLGRLAVLSNEDLEDLPVGATDFAVIDESGIVHDVIWSGKVTGYGW
jgi:hypothetical protein